MTKQNLRPLFVVAALTFTLGMGSRSEARAGPLIPPQTNTPLPSSTPSATPTEIPPTPSKTPEPTRTPTPTLDPIEEITTQYVIERVMLWAPYAEEIIELYEYDLDLALVLAVIAAESGGDQSVVSYAGAVGLMQVIDKPWYDIDPSGGPWGNMVLGMRILQSAIGIAETEGLPFEYGIALFNCSYDGVMNDRCGKGGLIYAQDVLSFWKPMIEKRLEETK